MAIARSAMEYEDLHEDHVAGLMDIELDAYPEPWTERMFREEARNPRSYFFVARLDGDLAGYGGFWLVLDEVHITSVTIRREFRQMGYGRELLDHLIATARAAGGRVATLEVRESNDAARQLYAKAGFEPVGVRKGYYPRTGEDAIVMSMTL